jgi:hypothetical protein
MRLLRMLFFIPVLLFVSPALLLLAGVIVLLETKQGPLRSILFSEIRSYGYAQGFRQFMQNVFVPTYKHIVQSYVLGAAGFLVVTVGLRGVGVLPLEYVYVALAVEFTLLIMWAITVFFTTEDQTVSDHRKAVLQPLYDDKTEKLVNTMKDLSAHLALLENRLKMTETRFEHLGKLDGSLQGLSSKLNLIVSDQFNLRVKREFDQLLLELSQRASGNNGVGKE